jgi:hypothetical protein
MIFNDFGEPVVFMSSVFVSFFRFEAASVYIFGAKHFTKNKKTSGIYNLGSLFSHMRDKRNPLIIYYLFMNKSFNILIFKQNFLILLLFYCVAL